MLVPGYLRRGGRNADTAIGASILIVWLLFFNWLEHYTSKNTRTTSGNGNIRSDEYEWLDSE